MEQLNQQPTVRRRRSDRYKTQAAQAVQSEVQTMQPAQPEARAPQAPQPAQPAMTPAPAPKPPQQLSMWGGGATAPIPAAPAPCGTWPARVPPGWGNGEEVPYGTKGSVRPDYYKDGYSVDIKNYNVESASGRSNLARNIEKQYYQRIENLPEGTKQSVMIDIRGQNVTDADLRALYNDIMKRTDNGVEIVFKMD